MAMDDAELKIKEQTIFDHTGNKIVTEDREIKIIAKLEEPLIVILGNVLSDEECDELIRLSKDRLHRSKIGNSREVDELRTSSSTFFDEGENEVDIRRKDMPTVKVLTDRLDFIKDEGFQVDDVEGDVFQDVLVLLEVPKNLNVVKE